MPKNLITPQELRDKLNSDNPPKVLDVRWSLQQPDGRADYEAGHIPGAIYVSLDEELADTAKPGLGRHPLPSPETVDDLLQRIGVEGSNDEVVVYDDWNRSASSRAWWILNASGMEHVYILNGGYSAWVDEDGEVDTAVPEGEVQDQTFVVPDLYLSALRPVLDANEAANLARAGLLLDARDPARYAGEDNPEGEKPGHIPGAASLAGTSLLDDRGFFRSPEELTEIFDTAGATPDHETGAYCGSGVTACVVVAAAHSIDRDIALFPGSWSQWSADPEAPTATGRE